MLGAYAAKLHINVVVVVLVNQLEVLDARLVNPTIKIEHKRLHLFIPLRRLIEEEHDSLCIINLELFSYLLARLIVVSKQKTFLG